MRRKFVGRLSVGLLAVIFTLPAWQAASGQRPKAAVADPFGERAQGASEPSEPRSTKAAEQEAASQQRSSRSRGAERIEHELSKITEIEVVEMPLKDCLLYFTEKHHIPILLNTKQLDAASIPADTPITKSLRGISLRSALNLMLADLECAFVIKDEVLQVTTSKDAQREFDVRIYDCRDLLGRQSAARAAAAAPNSAPAAEAGGVFGGASPGRGNEYEQRVAQLVALIKSNIDADTWQGGTATAGEPRGAVSEYGGLIVITQTAQTHEKVVRLLGMLREAMGDRSDGHVAR